ncbi:cuticle protein 21 [Penaeus vannamei]|uniref:cuticle protein 21 n=1 Tax=Penaeus vannamei TaxID=6689 RepID=UPI00387F7A72
MKLSLVLALLAATALAAPDARPVVVSSSVWPPTAPRPHHAHAPYTPNLTHEASSSYASVPSSFVSAAGATAGSSSVAAPPPKRPVPALALAPVKRPKPYYVPARSYAYAPAKKSHDYGWAVGAGGSSYGHRESTDGYTTEGSYFVDLPDGRRQKVTYYVSGDSGYVAEVSYEGLPRYPAHRPAYYKPVAAYEPAAHAHVHAPEYLVSSAHLPSPFFG